MASTGTALLDFGAFPGASDASIVITGQAGILSTSFVEAWIFPAATADHSSDEHVFETLKVMAGNIVAGTGFTIYGINTNQLNEPLETAGSGNFNALAGSARGFVPPSIGGKGTRLYGTFNVGWVWT